MINFLLIARFGGSGVEDDCSEEIQEMLDEMASHHLTDVKGTVLIMSDIDRLNNFAEGSVNDWIHELDEFLSEFDEGDLSESCIQFIHEVSDIHISHIRKHYEDRIFVLKLLNLKRDLRVGSGEFDIGRKRLLIDKISDVRSQAERHYGEISSWALQHMGGITPQVMHDLQISPLV